MKITYQSQNNIAKPFIPPEETFFLYRALGSLQSSPELYYRGKNLYDGQWTFSYFQKNKITVRIMKNEKGFFEAFGSNCVPYTGEVTITWGE